jgi:hypothetical protein
MSEHHDVRWTGQGTTPSRDGASDLSRIAVQQARQRMIAAAARPVAVKWRSMRRGDRFGTVRKDGPPTQRPPAA